MAIVVLLAGCNRGVTHKKWEVPDSAPQEIAAVSPSDSISPEADVPPRLAVTRDETRAPVYGGPAPQSSLQRQALEAQLALLGALNEDAGNGATNTSSLSLTVRGDVSVGALVVTGVVNGEAGIARLRPGFRSCYNKGLAQDPSMAGTLVLEIQIAASGDVSNVSRVSGAGLAADIERCIIRKATLASFDGVSAGGAKVRAPLSFRRQN
jgi:hypothetical protein